MLHCPNCHLGTIFRIQANVICEINEDEDFEHFTEDCWWEDDTECMCMTCKYKATLKEFVVNRGSNIVS